MAPTQPPTFDVASVKAFAPDGRSGGYRHQITPLGLTMLHVSMGYCIRLAYGVERSYELLGPAWIDPPTENMFDIVAKVSSPASEEQIKRMLQTLLAQRFGLAVHREKRSLPPFTLLLAKSPPILRQSDAKGPTKIKSGDKPQSMLFENVSMSQLALQLGPPWTSRPVVHMTGLQGGFDFTLDLARYILDETGKPILDWRGTTDTEGALLRALPEQLGLILKPDHAPVEVLVIDRVQKTPSAN